jgi:hypothetical protein
VADNEKLVQGLELRHEVLPRGPKNDRELVQYLLEMRHASAVKASGPNKFDEASRWPLPVRKAYVGPSRAASMHLEPRASRTRRWVPTMTPNWDSLAHDTVPRYCT